VTPHLQQWLAVAVIGCVMFFVITRAVLRRWLRAPSSPPPSFQLPEEDEEKEDLLIPEAEELHNTPSAGNQETLPRVVQRARAKTRAKPKKAKAPTKPRRPPKTRKTRFDRINDED